MHGKVLVAQGGGPTAVINQSLVGVVSEARRFHDVHGQVDEMGPIVRKGLAQG